MYPPCTHWVYAPLPPVHGDLDRIVCKGIDCESRGMETVAFEWDHKILSGVPFTTIVELVFCGEPGWVQNAAHTKSK